MATTPERDAWRVESHECPTCDAPPGSPCRTRTGRTAAAYHTPRFALVPGLRDELRVPVPTDRTPGGSWALGQVDQSSAPSTGGPIRIGYARVSTIDQDLASQLDALERAGCTRVFSEHISSRVRQRPELDAALTLAREIRAASLGHDVVLVVTEMKRLARTAAELMTIAADLQRDGIGLELLTGPLTGRYDPTGMGSMLFAILAVAAQLDRDYIREKTIEGQQAARARGNHGGRPTVIDPDMLTFTRALRAQGVPMAQIAAKLTIATGKNAGSHPSVATLYRALAGDVHTTSGISAADFEN